MDGKMRKTIKVLFFGAGKIGRHWLRRSRDFGIMPKGILDNRGDLWGTVCDNVIIYSPDKIKEFSFDHIFITCGKSDEIVLQLLELGVSENKLVVGGHNILNHLLYYAAENMTAIDGKKVFNKESDRRKVLFDLYNGMVLGGVESWSYGIAKALSRQGHEGRYLTTDAYGPIVMDETYPSCMLKYFEIEKDRDKIEACVKEIGKNLPSTIICNFPQYIFWAACVAKRLYPEQVRIIAVQHSDDMPYYYVYTLWQKYIDYCMVISSRIEGKLLSFGMEQNKIRHLEWQVLCKESMDRTWRKEGVPLQIGYAGRVTERPKRLDLFFVLAQTLKGKQVDFQITIAGAGDYGETLQERIKEEKLQNQIDLIGRIERENIPDFWQKQDIMISCSEWEGRSISQAEAMAEGAVPVITDVSGARDDVTDGYNGFVVAIGDVEAMAEKISYLYHNPEVLETMGIRAHDTIYSRQKDMDQTVFWEELLEEVWQS